MAVHITKPAQPDKAPVIVFGKHKGLLLPPGKVRPPNPENYAHVEYQGDHWVLYKCYVPLKDVTAVPK